MNQFYFTLLKGWRTLFNIISSPRYVSLKQFKYTLLFLLFITDYSYAQQQWYKTAVPRSRYVNSLKFLGPNTIIYGGGNEFYGSLQEIWLSVDKGLEWQNVNNVAGQPWIKSMAFKDTLHGFVVGDSATILKTDNGGYFWVKIPKPIQNREFSKIIYVTPKILFIVGGSIPANDTLQTIVKSIDGGNTWNVQLDRKGFWLNGVAFTDTLHGIAVGDNGVILKTVNGGLNWSTITPPIIRNFNVVKFINSSIGYIVGGTLTSDSLSTILRTNDGGNTWSVIKDITGGMLRDVTFSSSNIGYAVGDKALVLKTTNAGLNWSNVHLPDTYNGMSLRCVEFDNDDLGMIGAQDGSLYVYTTSVLASAYTLGSMYVDSTTTTVIGAVNTHGEMATTDFLYSLDSTFAINYPLSYHPEDIKSETTVLTQNNLTNLYPDTTYYYAFQTRTLAGLNYGDTLRLKTKAPKYIIQTNAASDVTVSNATLNGFVNKLPASATLSFEYGNSLLLGNEIMAIPNTINDTSSHNIFVSLNNLAHSQTYFYRLKVKFNNEFHYSNIASFTTLSPFYTQPATNITTTKANLNGYVFKFKDTATVSFEYGTTPLFGNEITATPNLINDTLFHSIYASLNNLEFNKQYYFRIKAVTSNRVYYSDIMGFTTDNPFHTTDANNVFTTSVTLNGFVYNSPATVSLSFVYGKTTQFGNQITAVPNLISDTLEHVISANLNNLDSNTTYYFKLRGINGIDTFFGEVKQFYTGTPFRIFQTLGATNIIDSSATLNGSIIAIQKPVNLSFEYGISPAMGNEVQATPGIVDDNLPHNFYTYINNLTPGTQYYFRIKGQIPLTTIYGDILVFQTRASYSAFETKDATSITDNSAFLNGKVKAFNTPISLSFEYGTSPALGNIATANPGTISDTFSHNISTFLSNLQTDNIYYYRLKGNYRGNTIYGETKQLYTGPNEIPNWDFQYWQTDTVNIPYHWNSIIKGFERVPGYLSNYALKVFGVNLIVNGAIGDGLFGGSAVNFTSNPDSVTFFASHNIAPGDTSVLILALKNNGNPISMNFIPLTGNTNGAFERYSFALHFDSTLIADTVIIGITPVNIFGSPSIAYDTVTIDSISFLPGNITFENSNFENWFTAIIESPESWFNFKYMGLNPQQPDSNHMISKVYFNAPDDYAVEITTVPFQDFGVINEGRLALHNGIFDEKHGGFPINKRHITLTGFYKYFPIGKDSMNIGISIEKNFVTIGRGDLFQGDSVTEFTPFSIPIIYENNDGVIPDTADIELRASISRTPNAGSRLIVDKLRFDGFITGVNESKPLNGFIEIGMKVYPNPARDHIIIENLLTGNEVSKLSLISLNGQLIRETEIPGTQKYTEMRTGDISPGSYLLILINGNKIFNKKIIIQ